ncbi:hypothetical protein Tco_0382996 [Tanacetum coccineum]
MILLRVMTILPTVRISIMSMHHLPMLRSVSLEVVESVIPDVGGVDADILLTIKDDILREKLLNVNLLIANIEALKDNPTPSSDIVTKSDYYHEEFADELAHIISPSEYDHLCFKIEPELGKSTIDVENDIF